MAIRTLYLDIDDTYLDTSRYLSKVCSANGLRVFSNIDIYDFRCLDDYSEIFKEVMSDYSTIPKKPGAGECLNLLKTEYDVVFCSGHLEDYEGEAKKKFSIEEGIPLILCDGRDKSHVDMKGGVICDDCTDTLKSVNASSKYAMYRRHNFTSIDDSIIVVYDWYELLDHLMKGEEDIELRRYICSRIQKVSAGSGF